MFSLLYWHTVCFRIFLIFRTKYSSLTCLFSSSINSLISQVFSEFLLLLNITNIPLLLQWYEEDAFVRLKGEEFLSSLCFYKEVFILFASNRRVILGPSFIGRKPSRETLFSAEERLILFFGRPFFPVIRVHVVW